MWRGHEFGRPGGAEESPRPYGCHQYLMRAGQRRSCVRLLWPVRLRQRAETVSDHAAVQGRVRSEGDDDVKRALQDSSNLHKLVETPPPDGESLVLRVKADFAPLIDALWGAGYYNGRVLVDLAGVPIELGRGPEDAAARAANAYRNRDVVPVKVIVETGPQFKLRALSIVERATGRPFD